MKELTFTLSENLEYAVNMEALTPCKLSEMSRSEIERHLLEYGSEKVAVAEVFKVSGEDVQNIVIENSNIHLERIGCGQKKGMIRVYGNAGAFAGENLHGGDLLVSGSVGDYAACSIQGGRVTIGGNAGNFLGAGYPGSKTGIKGGCIIVNGSTGIRAADRMRRGMLFIGGDVGEGTCSSMIAGTVVLLGQTAASLGCQMRRGTIICRNQPEIERNNFRQQTFVSITFSNLLLRSLQNLKIARDLEFLTQLRNRYIGDLSYGGMGEILT